MSLESGRKKAAAPVPRGQRWRLVDDPRSIRALAHPLRLELRSIVGRSGLITAADAAREVAISHGLASHHLRQLAKYGFVEQVDGADNRERPWRLVDTSYRFEGLEDKPGGDAAVEALEQVAAGRALDGLADWHERRSNWTRGWRKNAGVDRTTVYLTEKELAEVNHAVAEVLSKYVDERPLDDLASRPPGSVPVEFTFIVVPHEPTSKGH
jgi:DNA-binding transcriptional ArsR family regulator